MRRAKTMMQGTDLTLSLASPFALATAVRALSRAEIPMDGLCIVPERKVLHVVFSQELARKARQELTAAGLQVSEERTVLLMEMPEDPQEWFDRFRRLANAELKIDLLCIATDNRLIVGIEKGSTVAFDAMADVLEGKTLGMKIGSSRF